VLRPSKLHNLLDLNPYLHYIYQMRAIFIADAHLRRPDDTNYQLLLSFLGTLTGSTDMLVIAGDFFEFWLGDSPKPFPDYHPLLDRLAEVTAGGTRLVYIEGNHDFHLGGYFRRRFGADVHPDSAAINLDGRRLYICHGDLINPADRSYRLLRGVFRSRLIRLLAKIVPDAVPAWIARRLGGHSKSNHQVAASRWDSVRLTREFAAERFAEGYDVVVTAHYHRPALEEYDGKKLLALGDWISQFSYAEWLDGELTLKSYRG
jgi:UDP-2,3-diacylglucosamine hydrolase